MAISQTTIVIHLPIDCCLTDACYRGALNEAEIDLTGFRLANELCT